MYDNKIDTRTAKELKFLTHSFYLKRVGSFLCAFCTINKQVYFEMEFSSRNLSYTDSLHDRNLASLAGMLTNMFGVEPNPDFVFLGKPIDNIRFLLYRYISSIFQNRDSRLFQFDSDLTFRKFCIENDIEYLEQSWFNRIYFQGSDSEAESYFLQNSLIFQDLYFPKEKYFTLPSLRDACKLQEHYSFKQDFEDLYNVLNQHNISRLYHFTDKVNLKSILSNGLLSAKEILKRGLPCKYASSKDSRMIDKEMGLDDFVRLSFVRNHPMMHTSMTSYGLHPVIIEINPFIALMPNVFFSDRNTLRKNAQIGQNASDLKKIDFATILSDIAYYNLPTLEKKIKYQAEVIVKNRIGPEMILNWQELNELV